MESFHGRVLHVSMGSLFFKWRGGGSFLSGGWVPHWGALVLKEGGFRKKLLDGGHPPTMGNPVEYAEKNSNHTAAEKFHVAVRG